MNNILKNEIVKVAKDNRRELTCGNIENLLIQGYGKKDIEKANKMLIKNRK